MIAIAWFAIALTGIIMLLLIAAALFDPRDERSEAERRAFYHGRPHTAQQAEDHE